MPLSQEIRDAMVRYGIPPPPKIQPDVVYGDRVVIDDWHCIVLTVHTAPQSIIDNTDWTHTIVVYAPNRPDDVGIGSYIPSSGEVGRLGFIDRARSKYRDWVMPLL